MLCIDRLEGKELTYNGLASGEDRNVGDGLKDTCTMYRARAFLVNLDDESRKNTYSTSDSIKKSTDDTEEVVLNNSQLENSVTGVSSSSSSVVIDNDIGRYSENDDDDDDDEIPSINFSNVVTYEETSQVMCIELVGSRFLRQMVRIMVVSQ